MTAAIEAQMALSQQRALMGIIKQSVVAERQVVNILTEAVQTVPAGSRGNIVNTSA